jgi:hypothetical protein
LLLEQLAAHPSTAVRRAAAYCWGRQIVRGWSVARQLVRDPEATVRLRIARALNSVDDQPDSTRRQLLDELGQDISYTVRLAAAAPAVSHRTDLRA